MKRNQKLGLIVQFNDEKQKLLCFKKQIIKIKYLQNTWTYIEWNRKTSPDLATKFDPVDNIFQIIKSAEIFYNAINFLIDVCNELSAYHCYWCSWTCLICIMRGGVSTILAIQALLRLRLIIQTSLLGSYMCKNAWSTGRINIGMRGGMH